jgi:hypothetical protein
MINKVVHRLNPTTAQEIASPTLGSSSDAGAPANR